MRSTRRAATAGLLALGVLLGPARAVADERHRADRLAAIRAAVAEEAEDLERTAAALAGLVSVQPGSVTGEDLAAMAELPGAGRRVPEDLRTAHGRATIRLVKHTADTGWWSRSCTGTLIRIDGATYVLSAHHCFEADLQLDDDDAADAADEEPDLRDLTRLTDAEYGVIGPDDDPFEARPRTRLTHVAAPVDRSTDWALATLADPSKLTGVEPMDLDLDALGGPAPEPGQDVAQFSYPSSADPVPVATTGTYVGRSRTAVMGGYGRPVEVVAIDPAHAPEDPCFFGASGSSAVLADGTVLGPLGSRSTIGYGPDHLVDGQDSLVAGARLGVEDALRVDLREPAVLCGYAVLEPEGLRDLIEVLRRARSGR